jgi:CcmD family protein
MRHLRLLILVLALAAPIPSAAQPTPSPDEFQPMSEVPPEEQIPAITLVASAYGLVWLALFGYVWSLGRRLGQAEADLARLEQKAP